MKPKPVMRTLGVLLGIPLRIDLVDRNGATIRALAIVSPTRRNWQWTVNTRGASGWARLRASVIGSPRIEGFSEWFELND